MKILLLGSFSDMQTGMYLMNAFRRVSSDVAAVDVRRIIQDLGNARKAQDVIITEIEEMNINPDIILVLKGMEITQKTIQRIKEMYPNAKTLNWMFDKFVGGVEVWKNAPYIEFIKEFDYYICSLKGVADKLKAIGLDKIHFIPEGADEKDNGEVYVNPYQETKYGEDVSFIGTLGFLSFHKTRMPTLVRVAREGFNMKVWGEVVCEWKRVPRELRQYHMQETAVNERHSRVAQCSLINLGIDQDTDLELSQSARMYRIMCAGGLYLTNYVSKLETFFKLNKRNEMIDDSQELVVYYDLDDLIDKIDFLLEHNEIRESIAENGKKAILKEHLFKHRIDEILELIKTEVKKNVNANRK